MNIRLLVFAIIIGLVVISIYNTAYSINNTITGKVSHEVDGDTVDINSIRIRLSLVDTPEKGQPGFKESKAYVTTLCLGKNATVNIDDDQPIDRFGRTIGVLYCNGSDVNSKLLENGMARMLTEYCSRSEFKNSSWASLQCNTSISSQ